MCFTHHHLLLFLTPDLDSIWCNLGIKESILPQSLVFIDQRERNKTQEEEAPEGKSWG